MDYLDNKNKPIYGEYPMCENKKWKKIEKENEEYLIEREEM